MFTAIQHQLGYGLRSDTDHVARLFPGIPLIFPTKEQAEHVAEQLRLEAQAINVPSPPQKGRTERALRFVWPQIPEHVSAVHVVAAECVLALLINAGIVVGVLHAGGVL